MQGYLGEVDGNGSLVVPHCRMIKHWEWAWVPKDFSNMNPMPHSSGNWSTFGHPNPKKLTKLAALRQRWPHN
eukprot:2273618-Karenia_brevis.AAC.1